MPKPSYPSHSSSWQRFVMIYHRPKLGHFLIHLLMTSRPAPQEQAFCISIRQDAIELRHSHVQAGKDVGVPQ